jgi:hypothetical protein
MGFIGLVIIIALLFGWSGVSKLFDFIGSAVLAFIGFALFVALYVAAVGG